MHKLCSTITNLRYWTGGRRDLFLIEDLNGVYDDIFEGTLQRLVLLLTVIPESVVAGVHLCYGDPGHKHIIEPTDLGICVELANALCQRVPRAVNYIHMPVPRGRTDEAYYEPLTNLSIEDTQLVIGLVQSYFWINF